jgi:hypothetical protein
MTGAFLSRYHDLALVAHLGPAKGRDKDYLQRFEDGKAGWYHIPVSTTLQKSISYNVMNETRQCAIAVHVTGEKHRVLEYIYDVLSLKVVKRCDITAEQAGKASDRTDDFWLLELGASRTIAQPIIVKNVRKFAVFHTSATDIAASKQWSELRQRYASLVQKDG